MTAFRGSGDADSQKVTMALTTTINPGDGTRRLAPISKHLAVPVILDESTVPTSSRLGDPARSSRTNLPQPARPGHSQQGFQRLRLVLDFVE